MGLKIENLLVANFMTPYPITVDPEVSFDTVVDFMAERGVGNLVVSKGNVPEGILTEREVLKTAVMWKDPYPKKVKDIGFQSFIKITPDTNILEAARIMMSKKTRLLVFADNDKLVGIITASDMVRAFRKTELSPPLDEFVSKTIYQCSANDTILDVSRLMYDKRIGSVIVWDVEGYGIFTERDLLVHVLANEVDLNETVGGYSSTPLIVSEQDIPANKAASIMIQNNIKRLGLIKEGRLVGIVTARDLVDSFQSYFKKSNPYLQEIRT